MSISQSQDGIRASLFEIGNGNTITFLNKDNHFAWSCKVEGALIASDFSDVVFGERKAPIVSPTTRNQEDTAIINQGSIATKTTQLKAYQKDARTTASYLLNMISENQLCHVKPIRTNRAAMRKRLKYTSERTTKTTSKAAQMQQLNFQHIETRSAD